MVGVLAHDEAGAGRRPAFEQRARAEVTVGHPNLPGLGPSQQSARQDALGLMWD